MIALHDFQAVYFDIAKVASTSLKLYFSRLSKSFKPSEKYESSSSLPRISVQDLEALSDYFKFGFVRNPWDRIVSLYRDKIEDKSYDGATRFTIKDGVADCLAGYDCFCAGMSFEDFVSAISRLDDSESDAHFKSQHQYICDGRGAILVDFLGRFERINHDIRIIQKKLSLPEIELPHLQSTNSGNWREYYSAQSRAILGERYRTDIELFNYTF